ncbi:universal stress protein [Halomonas sp. CUBES01]|uniref:Universal stress protein n=1 Tax=Vreelandella gomseomensis TaxID=370766 RepID=A0ABU1G9Q6_9GAMM|nr:MULTISPECIES: universal stress protein [Halomonas]MDR5874213.1 universal stress protein [Halomonas gomseomensis]MEC4768871.1 universal stress protein [Halomonas sp. CUBES01]
MTRTVLFATDLSAENRAAFARALRLAYADGAQLDIIHVLDPYLPRRVFHDVEAAVVDDIAATLNDIREDYALEAPQTLIQTVAGAPYVEIIREAHERQAGLVVVGMHRKRGQKDLLMGATSMRILRSAPCPVVVASQPPTQPWQSILVPIDFSLTARHSLREALQRFPDASLTLLHAWRLPGERELGSHPYYAQWRDHEVARLREQLSREIDSLMSELAGVPDVELVLEHGAPCEVLGGYIKRHTPDLVVIGSRDQPHHASELTAMLLSEPHCDVMLCRV